ncbi:MAG: acyltransferase [Pseudomonadota bacterium]|nr:acyltransferase [Pseudomonadota bacterium]
MSTPVAGNNFDIIRFGFASLVILSHSYPLATGTEIDEPLMRLSGGQMTLGTLSVYGFFMISGYLIAQSWARKPQITSFLSKRVRRIYPGFLVASTLCAFVVAPIFSETGGGAFTPAFALDFAAHALRLIFLQPFAAFPGNPSPGPVNGSLWSIPFEFWCYVGLMVVGLLGGLKRPTWLAAALPLLMLAAFVVAFRDLRIGGKWLGAIFGYPVFWSRLLPYFVAGMLFQSCGARIRYSAFGAWVAAASLAVACAIPYALGFVLPLAGAYLILWLAFLPTTHASRFARHGDYSYGIYLYAFPIQQMLAHWSGTHAPWLLFAMAWPATIVAGALSWHLVEHRFIRSQVGQRALPDALAPN